MTEFKKIVSVKRVSRHVRVYNFDVPNIETYAANGFVVHNCQNYKISQEVQRSRIDLWREQDLVALAQARNATGIAFTFSEPTIYYGYISQVGADAKKASLSVVLKTNGFTNRNVLKWLRPVVDAYNVDIKGSNADYVRLGGRRKPVLRAIETMLEFGHHVEISYLVLPHNVDNNALHKRTAKWLAKLNPLIPVHLLYAYPCYQMTESYPPAKLRDVCEVFCADLNFVYISNLYSEEFLGYRDTFCPVCGKIMVSRRGRVKVFTNRCCVQVF